MSSELSTLIEGSNDESIFIFDSGDLHLLVTYSNDQYYFVVSSHAMSLASPVWKKFLHPPFSTLPSKEESESHLPYKKLDFKEDDAEALFTLLRTAHLQFSKVPATLTFESILNIAVLCDKYDCVGLVKPWLNSWLANESTQYKEPGHEEWLFVAWVFGRENIFKAFAAKLVCEVRTNSKEDFPTPMPPDIIGKLCIMQLRIFY